MANPRRTQPPDKAVMGESRNAATRHGESARDAQGFRAAYEALIEPLIEATIKLAAAETEQQIKQTQITALKRELADKRAGLRNIQERHAETGAMLALIEKERDRVEKERDRLAQELQALYASHSWRLTKPLRRTMTANREWRPTISMLVARASGQVRLAAATTASFGRQAPRHAAEVLR